MKLELKHLAPYLPYGLKNQRAFHKPRVIDGIVGNKVYFGDTVLFLNQIEPILRPLSDLKKLDTSNFTEYFKSRFDMDNWGIYINDIPVSDMQKLFKNHFDVFGLIEKGLAIDINTI